MYIYFNLCLLLAAVIEEKHKGSFHYFFFLINLYIFSNTTSWWYLKKISRKNIWYNIVYLFGGKYAYTVILSYGFFFFLVCMCNFKPFPSSYLVFQIIYFGAVVFSLYSGLLTILLTGLPHIYQLCNWVGTHLFKKLWFYRKRN